VIQEQQITDCRIRRCEDISGKKDAVGVFEPDFLLQHGRGVSVPLMRLAFKGKDQNVSKSFILTPV
jgi:hypothetical protein